MAKQDSNVRERLTYAGADLQKVVSRSRELLVDGVFVRKATLGEILPELAKLRQGDEIGRAEVALMTKRVSAKFMLSPNGQHLYTVKPTTRVIDGVKRSILSIKEITPLSGVLSFELKGGE